MWACQSVRFVSCLQFLHSDRIRGVGILRHRESFSLLIPSPCIIQCLSLFLRMELVQTYMDDLPKYLQQSRRRVAVPSAPGQRWRCDQISIFIHHHVVILMLQAFFLSFLNWVCTFQGKCVFSGWKAAFTERKLAITKPKPNHFCIELWAEFIFLSSSVLWMQVYFLAAECLKSFSPSPQNRSIHHPPEWIVMTHLCCFMSHRNQREMASRSSTEFYRPILFLPGLMIFWLLSKKKVHRVAGNLELFYV